MSYFDPREQLLDSRRIMVSQPLVETATTDIAAMLMTLDGRSADPVELLISGPGGPIADVMSLLDIVQLMRAPVATVCLGAATGTAAALVACGTGGRRASRRATLSLRCDDRHEFGGHPADVVTKAEELVTVRAQLVARLAEATGQHAEWVDHQLDRGGNLAAPAALERGLIDELTPSGPRS